MEILLKKKLEKENFIKEKLYEIDLFINIKNTYSFFFSCFGIIIWIYFHYICIS